MFDIDSSFTAEKSRSEEFLIDVDYVDNIQPTIKPEAFLETKFNFKMSCILPLLYYYLKTVNTMTRYLKHKKEVITERGCVCLLFFL